MPYITNIGGQQLSNLIIKEKATKSTIKLSGLVPVKTQIPNDTLDLSLPKQDSESIMEKIQGLKGLYLDKIKVQKQAPASIMERIQGLKDLHLPDLKSLVK